MFVCAACRLLQARGPCADCAFTQLVEPRELVEPIVTGVTTTSKPPATGWRDNVALTATALGVCVGGTVGAFAGGGFGLLVGMTGVAALGYSKQFWRTAFTRSMRVSSVDALPAVAHDTTIEGVVKRYERTVKDDTVAIETTYRYDTATVVRTLEAMPFWIVAGDRRVLIEGPVRISSAAEPMAPLSAMKELAALGVPVRRSDRSHVAIVRRVLRADAAVTAKGILGSKQLADGYRDNHVETLVGVALIER